MRDDIMIWTGAALAVAAVGLLRLAWGKPERSHALNTAGWGLLLAGVVSGGMAAGAWGIAIVSLPAMIAAFVALAVAGVKSPQGRTKASTRRVGLMPEKGEPRRIGCRATTFLLTIVAGFAVSLGLGMAVRALGGALGWAAPDANVAAFFTVPLAWSALVFALLMQDRRRTQILTLLVCSLPVLPVLASGAMA